MKPQDESAAVISGAFVLSLIIIVCSIALERACHS